MSREHPAQGRWSAFDDLGAAEREELLRHAYECAECRDRLLEADPTRAFALLSVRPLPAPVLERVSAEVRRRLDAPEPARDVGGLAWGAIAASLVLAATLSGLVVRHRAEIDVPVGGPRVESVRAGVEPAPDHGEPAAIEVLSPAGAEVYDLSVGDAHIVMVFDSEIDI